MALPVALGIGIDRGRDAAQGHPVIERDVVADLRGLADHHAHAVVDEEAAADAGAGMDLDAGQEAAEMRERRGRSSRQPRLQSAMGQPVQTDGMEARIASAPPPAATARPGRGP